MRRFLPVFAIGVVALVGAFGCKSDHHDSAHRAAAAPKPEFTSLFNGKDLAGWEGDKRFWSVQDGTIVGQTTAENKAPHNTFLIWRGGVVNDFELHLQFKLTNHNSGVQYRSKEAADYVVSGYQADIADGNPNRYTGILYEEKGRGILAERGQRVVIDETGKKTAEPLGDKDAMLKAIRADDWNDYVIVAKGNHLTHTINGVQTVDVTDNDPAKSAREGILALQIHTGPPMKVQFRDIRLKTPKP